MSDDKTTAPPPGAGMSVGELADAAGVTRRAVRYYVQQGLLPSPVGLGRSAFYTDHHLAHLRRIKALQEQGLGIAAIRYTLSTEAATVPAAKAASTPAGPAPAKRSSQPAVAAASADAEPYDDDLVESWIRMPMIDGIELHVRVDRLRRVPMDLLAEMSANLRHHLRSEEGD